ncbi:MAG: sulfur carrier protein ThiS [Salinivirgaceae bacterium]|jgi:sulfur carrier protein|nr:sulfur carrier protein ThiS [Salinivirgaceae bacterium]
MKLTINHKEEDFSTDELTLNQLLKNRDLTFKRLLIRINGSVVTEEEKSDKVLKDGDQLDIVRIISGG